MSNHDQPPMVVPSYTNPMASLSAHPLMDYDTEMSHRWDPREYLYVLMKRKWWIIGTFISVVLVGALYTFTRTPIFRTTTTLQITQENPGSQLSMDQKLSQIGDFDNLEKFQQTQFKILKSWSLAQRVMQALNLWEHPGFKGIREQNPNKSKAQIEDAIVGTIVGNLEVNPVKNSFLVGVSYQSPDKSLAQEVVNSVANEYIYLSIDRRNESFALVRKWLDVQLQAMATRVQEAQRKLYKFGQKTDIYTTEDKDNVVTQKFIDLSSLLTKAQAEKMGKEAQYQQIREKGPDAPQIVNHPLIAALRQQLVAQKAKISALQKVYRGGHPELQTEQANLVELQSRVQAEVKRLQESVKADYEAANRAEKLLNDSFSNQKQQMVKLQDHLSDFQILKRDAQTNEQLYQALLARVKEANIAGTMVPTNVAVIDPARLPTIPFKPNTERDLALVIVLGLALGIGLAFGLEYMDNSIKSSDDLERFCNLPALGIVPMQASDSRITFSRRKKSAASGMMRYLPRLERGDHSNIEMGDMDMIVSRYPKSQVSEAILHVYSSLMLSTSGKPPSAILITSPNPSEGKTMLASNLAISCALNNRSVVLIDCDLRKPRMQTVFGVSSQPGLTNYLTGNATLAEVLRPTGIPNLALITAGARPPNPSNLLNSDVFKEMLTQLREQFRHIIIDTPPVLGFADARFIAVLMDAVLLTVRYNHTHKSAGFLAHQLLSQSSVMGAVLNFVGRHGQSYGKYYYYYYSKYYSKYYEDK